MYPNKTKAERMPYHYILIMMYNDAWYGEEPYLINHKVNNNSVAYYLNKGEFEFKRDYWSEITGLTIKQIRIFENKLEISGIIEKVVVGKGQSPIYKLGQYSGNTQGNTQGNTRANIPVNKEVNKGYSNENTTVNLQLASQVTFGEADAGKQNSFMKDISFR